MMRDFALLHFALCILYKPESDSRVATVPSSRHRNRRRYSTVNAACENGLNMCCKPQLLSAGVAQPSALRAATPVTRVRILCVYHFFKNPLNPVFGLFSIKPLTI